MTKTETALHSIALADLHYTPDRRDMGDLKALAASIKAHGLQVPLVITLPPQPCNPGEGFIVLDGRRRLEAAKIAGLPSLPCIVAEDSNPDISLILNTHRLNLSPLEMLDSIKALIGPDAMANGYWTPETVKAIAAKVNLSVDDTLKLLTLNRCGENIKELVHSKKLTLATAILSVNLNEKQAAEFATFCLDNRPSYRDAKRWLVNNKVTKRLSDAEFDTKGCKDCQFNGDRSPALFDQAELGEKEAWYRDQGSCFNPECYKKKLADFNDGMKLKAQKLGLKKAGISTQNRWSMDGLVKFEEAARIDPEKCPDCKLVKWCRGQDTKGKYVLYCPTQCPNIKQPKGKKAEAERPGHVSVRKKLEKNIPLTPGEKKDVIKQHREEIAAKLAGDVLEQNIKKVSALNLIKMILMHQPGIAEKKLAQFQAAKLDDLKPELIQLLEDSAENYNSQMTNTLANNQAMYTLATGKALDMAAVDEALPENIKALLPGNQEKKIKKGKK
ncbi:MAG: ParB N-terminal domain-containing protein [Candidatus Edwardsbacteria bacterium]|nr:ParB N-terminal domain-containing protein [Candidatus Edwardsbacteria bacterium]